MILDDLSRDKVDQVVLAVGEALPRQKLEIQQPLKPLQWWIALDQKVHRRLAGIIFLQHLLPQRWLELLEAFVGRVLVELTLREGGARDMHQVVAIIVACIVEDRIDWGLDFQLEVCLRLLLEAGCEKETDKLKVLNGLLELELLYRHSKVAPHVRIVKLQLVARIQRGDC